MYMYMYLYMYVYMYVYIYHEKKNVPSMMCTVPSL